MKIKGTVLAFALAAASELVKEFHQSSVLINTERVQTEFYEGE